MPLYDGPDLNTPDTVKRGTRTAVRLATSTEAFIDRYMAMPVRTRSARYCPAQDCTYLPGHAGDHGQPVKRRDLNA
jgi:hypothetical protein